MLKEFVDRIVSLAPTQSRLTATPLVGNPRKVVLDQGGEHQIIDTAPPLRQHQVATLADLTNFAARVDVAPKPVVWHAPGAVILILNDDDRLERVVLPLGIAPTFTALQELTADDEACLFTPKALSNFVKLQLAGCDFPQTVIEGLRKLKWESKQTMRQELSSTRESIGKDVEAELTATIELPESIAVKTPVYANIGEEQLYFVNCVVDVRAFEQKIAFLPVPGELEDAINLAQASIRGRVESNLPKGTPIFAGTP